MRETYINSKLKEPAFIAAITGLLLAIFMVFFGYQRYQLFKSQQDRLLENKLQNVKDKIEAALRNGLSATKTLSLFVIDGKGEENFEIIAPQILQTHIYIDAVQLVKGGVITQVYPMKGNEKAIGYNILEDTSRNIEAIKAIETKQLFFAGPFDLRQGYKAIVGRLPIFIDNKFWGFSAVIIKLSTFLQAAGLNPEPDSEFIFQLSKADPNSGKEVFYLPDSENFQNSSDLVTDTIQEGNWKIYVKPKRSQVFGWMAPIVIIGLALSFFSSFLAYSLAKQPIVLRKLVEEKTHEISESEEKFRTLVEQTNTGVFIEQENKLIYVNPGFEKIFGYSRGKLIDTTSFYALLENAKKDNQEMEWKLSSTSFPVVLKAKHSDGNQIFIEIILSEILYNKQPALIGTCVDITSRVERDVRFNKAIIEAQENERQQVGMELHDNVLQIIAASMLNIDYLNKKFSDTEEIAKATALTKKYLTESIDEIRRLSHQLTPSVSDTETLKEKIDDLIDGMTKSTLLKTVVAIDDFQPPLNNETQVSIYRILQEQLNNIIKHSRATDVSINIYQEKNNVIAEISDNGIGFNNNFPKLGIGLENIKRRAFALSGEATIISSPGNGCRVVVKIPLV